MQSTTSPTQSLISGFSQSNRIEVDELTLKLVDTERLYPGNIFISQGIFWLVVDKWSALSLDSKLEYEIQLKDIKGSVLYVATISDTELRPIVFNIAWSSFPPDFFKRGFL